MYVDARLLGTFTELAHDGAEAATRSLTQLTGVEASVDVTKVSLVERDAVGSSLERGSFVGVQFGLEGGLSGRAVLAFEREGSEALVAGLLGGAADESMAQSGLSELGNIMMSGFIDGWADYLGTSIAHSPPTYVEAQGSDLFDAGPASADDQAFVFHSGLQCAAQEVTVAIYVLPDADSMAELLSTRSAESIAVEKLAAFNRMTREGAQTAAENVTLLSGVETEAEVARLSFMPIENVPEAFDDTTYIGTAVEFTGTPSGFLLVLFDERAAAAVAEALVPTAAGEGSLTADHNGAIEEIGNVITSGFVDGWANVLQRSVDHTPPRLVHDMGRALVDPLVAQLGQHQRHAFVVDSRMHTAEFAFEIGVHAFPDERELRAALSELDVDRADQTEADPTAFF